MTLQRMEYQPLVAKVKIGTYLRIIRDPTMVNAPPVAQDGMDAKMGAKKMDTKNIIPVMTAVKPVLPPSVITRNYY